MSTIDTAWKWFLGELCNRYSENEAKAMARVIFGHFFNIEPAFRILNSNTPFDIKNLRKLENILSRLNEQEPVQYVTGIVQFCDLLFNVDKRVLIPRPETEELVQWVHEVLKKEFFSPMARIKILDVGTGSGCIAVTMASNWPNAGVFACDISADALAVARANAIKNKVRVKFFKCDVLTDSVPISGIDVVISNPPYVLNKEKAFLKQNVVENEPHVAIFVPDDDPLVFYRKIGSRAFVWLIPGGFLFFEINEQLSEETAQCILKAGFEGVTLRNDIHGKPRFLMAQKPINS
ncbi:MAG TPA: peptide chain release factor N(5)-glutamine methyltransferase [Bacteroidales bacterium]|nr:peptide chain release factor N(5)-glutamine methyltransferase [Bacteroidales bacterium]